MRTSFLLLFALATVGAGGPAAAAGGGCAGVMPFSALLDLPYSPPDHRVSYGADRDQFGELRVPTGDGPHPVALVIHGGCWLADYGVDHIRPVATALTAAGFATWTIEYRRIGTDGGGWPGTFLDVARAADLLPELAVQLPLDLERVVVVGHSAGGHLALWLAARPSLPEDDPTWSGDPLPIRAVVSLAGIPDLAEAAAEGICGDAASRLLGGAAALVSASPAERLPIGTPQLLIAGACDPIVPPAVATRHADAAAAAGDDVEVHVIEGVGHFELVAPGSAAWPTVLEAVQRSVAGPQHRRSERR